MATAAWTEATTYRATRQRAQRRASRRERAAVALSAGWRRTVTAAMVWGLVLIAATPAV